MNYRPYNVLFLCTGNSARSILAEALLNQRGQGQFRAFSAGGFPAGRVNPCASALLQENGFPVEQLRSKSWDEFTRPDTPEVDSIFTVCDNAAGEVCPIWPGQPVTAHWGIPDPAAVQGTDAQKRAAFTEAFITLEWRVNVLINLPLATLDRQALGKQLTDIGRA